MNELERIRSAYHRAKSEAVRLVHEEYDKLQAVNPARQELKYVQGFSDGEMHIPDGNVGLEAFCVMFGDGEINGIFGYFKALRQAANNYVDESVKLSPMETVVFENGYRQEQEMARFLDLEHGE